MSSGSLMWVGLVALFTLAMFLMVPVRNISRLLLFGLVGGLGVALVVMTIMDPVLQLSRYNFASIPGFLGIPVLAAVAWIPVEIIFANYLPKMRTKTNVYLYVGAFALGATILDYVTVLLGMRGFIRWNLLSTFALAAVIHACLAYYLTVTGYAREKLS